MRQEEGLVSNMYENRNYLIFFLSEIDLINFDEVLQTSIDTLRKSIDQTKAIISWEVTIPNCVNLLMTKSEFYTHEEILEQLNSIEWNEPYPQ
jgi:hypothetical protein